MPRSAPVSRPWLTTPVFVLVVTALGFALVALFLTLRLRSDFRAQILQREAEAIASMVALQERRAEDELTAVGLGSEMSDWFPYLLETTRLRGVVTLRLFDAAGELRDAAPMPVSAKLPGSDWPRLRGGEAFARFFANVDSDTLRVGDPEFVAEGGDPLLEIVVPLKHPLRREFVGAAQYWIEGEAMAAEFRRLDRALWLRGGLAAGLGAAFVVAALAWAFRRLRAAHRELQDRSEDLARANHEFSLAAKTSAVGAITAHLLHGLKNPLDGLEGYVSNQPTDDSRAGGEEWRAAMETTQRIRTLINEVLAILREEQTGGATYRVTSAELIAAAEEKIRPFAQSCGVAFAVRREDDSELPGRRAHLVLLVLDNLLRNACEATPRGGQVTLTVARLASDAVFSVEDSGPGLSLAVQDRLFQPVASTKTGGGGIGLVLSHQLAQHAGGFLTLDKSDARGCRFRLAVPVAAQVLAE
ncbi:MAG: HAMP domain-containing sensor histidine kinase [Verrucomicrobiota bacterium]